MSDPDVEPLEDRAYFQISATDEGYVRIEQSVGDPPVYTPQEARDIAEDIRAAADEATR
ncbi:MAG: DUF6324 family protein [Halobacteriales archaeon]